MSPSTRSDPTTALVSDADVDALLATVRPSAYKMRAMLTLALSREGLRHDLFGTGRYSQDARGRAETAATRAGFVIEYHPVDHGDASRTVIRRRWRPELRPGLVTLLSWNEREGGLDLILAMWMTKSSHRAIAAPILRNLTTRPEAVHVLGCPPGDNGAPGSEQEMIGWFQSATDVYATLTDNP